MTRHLLPALRHGYESDSVRDGTVSNTSNYSVAPGGSFTTIAGGAEVVTVKVGTATASVSLANGTTKAQALQQLNDSFNALGVFAVNDAAGTNIEFQSKSALQLHGNQHGCSGRYLWRRRVIDDCGN